MKTLKFFPFLCTALFFLVFSSCQKEELMNTQTVISKDHYSTGSDSRMPSYFGSRDLMCTLADYNCNPSPMGACLILFPPDGPYDIPFSVNDGRGIISLDENGEISVHVYSDMELPASNQNTTQPFTIGSNMFIPADVMDQISNGNSSGDLNLTAGVYTADVKDNYLTVSAPTDNAGPINFVFWYNSVVNPIEIDGYHHNKWMADLHHENQDIYNGLNSPEEIHDQIIADCEAYCIQHGLGNQNLTGVEISGQSSVEMINDLANFTVYEKSFLVNFANEVTAIDPFTNDGMSDALALINSYESAAAQDANISNQEAVLSFLAVTKYSARYWNTGGDSTPSRMSKFWWTVLCDAIGAGKGFLLGGWPGAAIGGVAYSLIGNLTYDHYF